MARSVPEDNGARVNRVYRVKSPFDERMCGKCNFFCPATDFIDATKR